MRPHVATGRRVSHGEDAEAAIRALFGLTGGVGGSLTLMAAVVGQVPWTAPPTLILLGCLVAGAPIGWAAWAAAGVWAVMLPSTPGEALVAPLAMIVICAAVALGPDRLLGWLERDAVPTPDADDAGAGWIEEAPRRIG